VDKEKDGENGNKPATHMKMPLPWIAISIDSTCHWESGEGEAIKRSAIVD
jgi:hypothetical protein